MAIEETTFGGLQAVELTTDAMRLVVVTQCGPRIAFLGKPGGPNILLWKPGEHTRGDWDLRGGHRVWATTPGADECEDTYVPDNEPCDVGLFENGFCVAGATSPVNCTRRGLEVTLLGEDKVKIDNFILNAGEMLYSAGVWALTCTLPTPATRYAIPVGDGSSWDNFTMVSFREWAGHGQGGFDDPQIAVTNDLVLVTPAGVENKRMLQAHKGIIAMSDAANDVTFAKKATYDPTGQYPLNTNIAFYIGPDNFMVEMETMGPGQTLKPGTELHHVETWALVAGALPFTDADQVEALFAP